MYFISFHLHSILYLTILKIMLNILNYYLNYSLIYITHHSDKVKLELYFLHKLDNFIYYDPLILLFSFLYLESINFLFEYFILLLYNNDVDTNDIELIYYLDQ